MAAGPAAAAGAVTWTGNGTDSITECAPDVDPYLHWILTKGGPSSLGSGSLDIDGDDYTGFYPSGQQNGALHFLTPYYDPEDIDSAVATYSGTSPRNSVLTISSGCVGEEPPSS
jgi:hypothetical protein